jgi:hypothetical protein
MVHSFLQKRAGEVPKYFALAVPKGVIDRSCTCSPVVQSDVPSTTFDVGRRSVGAVFKEAIPENPVTADDFA